MRKYLFNGAIISSIIGGWNAIQTTRKGPRDWRLAIGWIIWGLSLAVAIGTVRKDSEEHALSSEHPKRKK
ncbi:hypothetical protein WDJ51_10010 [Rathayibacter sp. YIM 133350]|uniref:hypothetical protein n=1 Tax=Rathayibacter sp. YIM 133350 TaxID=3131992 RepID=UPI00307E3375